MTADSDKYAQGCFDATSEYLEKLYGGAVQRKTATEAEGDKMRFDISGMISLTGNPKITITNSFEVEMARDLATKFVGPEIEVDKSIVEGTVGEVSNIIAGLSSRNIDLNLQMGLPQIVIGHDHNIHLPGDGIILTCAIYSVKELAFHQTIGILFNA